MIEIVNLPSQPAQTLTFLDDEHLVAAGWDGVLYTIKKVCGQPVQGSPTWRLFSTHGKSLAGALGHQVECTTTYFFTISSLCVDNRLRKSVESPVIDDVTVRIALKS